MKREEIMTPHGIFTSNELLGLSAQESYEQWLINKDKLKEQKKDINIEDALKSVLAGDYQSLAYILYPEDFE